MPFISSSQLFSYKSSKYHLYFHGMGFIIWTINRACFHELFEVSPSNQIFDFFFKVVATLCLMVVIMMKDKVFTVIPRRFHHFRLFEQLFIPNFHMVLLKLHNCQGVLFKLLQRGILLTRLFSCIVCLPPLRPKLLFSRPLCFFDIVRLAMPLVGILL